MRYVEVSDLDGEATFKMVSFGGLIKNRVRS
jgi:hypothetical protein